MRLFVYRVTESKNKDFAVGEYVVANVGWVDRGIGTAQNSSKLPDGIPADKHSMALGVLGMPGYDNYKLGVENVIVTLHCLPWGV